MTKQSIHIKVTNSEAAGIARATEDAYSFSTYKRAAWTMIAKRLAQRGYDAQQIEAVLRNKITRWAADNAKDSMRGATSADVMRFIDDRSNRCTPEYIEQLTADTFGEKRLHPHARGLQERGTIKLMSGADLAGFCEGEDTAELIDLAFAIKRYGGPLTHRATAILDRIERRAK